MDGVELQKKTEMKIVEADSASRLTTAINEHLARGWLLAGNNYRVFRKTAGEDSYSVMMMHVNIPADPATLALYDEGKEVPASAVN